jgi:enamine deaminase RidA (YjgF/YER057c/UK114 family)
MDPCQKKLTLFFLMKKSILSTLLVLLVTPGWIVADEQAKDAKSMSEPQIRFLNRAPAGYSQVVEVRGGRTLYISGQVALDSSGTLVGPGDFTAQLKQVFANLKARLDEAGASFNDVVKLNFYLVDASNVQIVRDVRDTYVNRERPPASTAVVVKQLIRPELLVEVDAIAVTKD